MKFRMFEPTGDLERDRREISAIISEAVCTVNNLRNRGRLSMVAAEDQFRNRLELALDVTFDASHTTDTSVAALTDYVVSKRRANV